MFASAAPFHSKRKLRGSRDLRAGFAYCSSMHRNHIFKKKKKLSAHNAFVNMLFSLLIKVLNFHTQFQVPFILILASILTSFQRLLETPNQTF